MYVCACACVFVGRQRSCSCCAGATVQRCKQSNAHAGPHISYCSSVHVFMMYVSMYVVDVHVCACVCMCVQIREASSSKHYAVLTKSKPAKSGATCQVCYSDFDDSDTKSYTLAKCQHSHICVTCLKGHIASRIASFDVVTHSTHTYTHTRSTHSHECKQ